MNDITSIHCWEEILNRWSAVQSQCRPDLGDRRINEKMRICHMVLLGSSLWFQCMQSPRAPPGTLNVHLRFITPWPFLCTPTLSTNSSHCHTPLRSHSTWLWKLPTPVSSDTRPTLLKSHRVNYLSLDRVPIRFHKDDITPILPITMALTRTCNQQTSVLS